jgi:hypothetical protein
MTSLVWIISERLRESVGGVLVSGGDIKTGVSSRSRFDASGIDGLVVDWRLSVMMKWRKRRDRGRVKVCRCRARQILKRVRIWLRRRR